MDDAERAAEQSYFDNAADWRRKSDETRATTIHAAANAGARARIAKLVRRREREAPANAEPIEQVAVGRMDFDDGETFYVGKRAITDGDKKLLVISWTSDFGARYYGVNPAQPQGMVRKREFACQANTILSYADILFDALTRELAEDAEGLSNIPLEFSDLLLAELDRDRGPELRDIVATIHATQYQLISAPLGEVLVVDGGPGTGKTVVLLHRISWLLANNTDTLAPENVLVVGPNRTFLSYTELVLPSLGDVAVDQREIGDLAPAVSRGRSDPDELARLKGDARMVGLLARALDARTGAPEATERLSVEGSYVTLPGDEVSEALAQARLADLPYAQRRQLLRDALHAQLVRRLDRVVPVRVPSLDNLVDRLWPQLSAPAFLADLYNSRRRLAAAGAGRFSPAELAALHRRSADRISQEVWSDPDLALLDEVEWLINGWPQRTYAHVAVDEVQDLSPMQLRAVARRCSTGSMTLAGDLAQATGPAAASSWEQVLEHLPASTPARVVALRFGYRVPRQVHEFAARLLPVIAPGMSAPLPIRSGPAEPQIHHVSEHNRMAEVVRVALAHADADRFVGIICPPSLHEELAAQLDRSLVNWQDADRGELGARVNLVSPRWAKGLEFDAVVVVEPEEIVSTGGYGHRLLYVAFTRTTRYLDVVCVGDPLPLTVPQRPKPVVTVPTPRPSAETVAAFARDVAETLRAAYPPELWLDILQATAELLSPPPPASGRHARRHAAPPPASPPPASEPSISEPSISEPTASEPADRPPSISEPPPGAGSPPS